MDFLNKGMKFFSKKDKNQHENTDDDDDNVDMSNPIALFQKLDQNGDGKITEEDFVLAINKLGLGSVGETAVRHAFKQLDKNKNGKLDMSEAWAAFEAVKSLFDKVRASGAHSGGGGSAHA